MSYPRCEAMSVLIETEAGPRVSFNKLLARLYERDQIGHFWSQSTHFHFDNGGLLPESIEPILESLPEPLSLEKTDPQGQLQW